MHDVDVPVVYHRADGSDEASRLAQLLMIPAPALGGLAELSFKQSGMEADFADTCLSA